MQKGALLSDSLGGSVTHQLHTPCMGVYPPLPTSYPYYLTIISKSMGFLPSPSPNVKRKTYSELQYISPFSH